MITIGSERSGKKPGAACCLKRRRMTLKGHKYLVGQTVQYTAGAFGRSGASGSFRIVKLLPSEGDDYQYRIKSVGEPYERVAKESQLDRPQ
jgi:hypothetical protein